MLTRQAARGRCEHQRLGEPHRLCEHQRLCEYHRLCEPRGRCEYQRLRSSGYRFW